MPIHTLTRIDLYGVTIDGLNYHRPSLSVYMDQAAGKLYVSQSGNIILDGVLYSDLHADGASVGFADYPKMAEWVNTYMISGVITLLFDSFNLIGINGEGYKRFGLLVDFNSDAQTVSVSNSEVGQIFSAVYSNITIQIDGPGFSSYDAMVEWINRNLRFNGHYLSSDKNKPYFMLNGHPYYRNELHRVWDDTNQSLELRYAHNELTHKPMPMTSFKNIVVDDENDTIGSYAALIDWIANQTLI